MGISSLTLLALVFHLPGTALAASDCIFGETEGCFLPCRCQINSDGGCDKITGECYNQSCLQTDSTETLIGQDWSGPKCQTGNVAYGKTAYLKETNGLTSAIELTDGLISPKGCLQEDDNQETLVLLVNLERKHKLDRISLFLSQGTHEILVEIGDSVDENEGFVACGESMGNNHDDIVNIPCLAIGQAMRITIIKPNVTICEVTIQGHIYQDIDCQNCEGECSPNLFCEICKPGFQPPGCTQECPDGTYGPSCENKCGNCKDAEHCDKSNGNCHSGCEMWYIHPGLCQLYIEKTGVVNNIDPPKYHKVYSYSLHVVVHRFRSHKPDLSWNYLMQVEYAALHGKYQATEDRIFEGAIGPYGLSVIIRNLKPNIFYSIRIAVYRVWGDEHDFIGYSAPRIMKTGCAEPKIKDIQVKKISQEEILVSWQNASSECDYIHTADLFFTKAKGNGNFSLYKSVEGATYSMYFETEWNVKYYFKVRLTNNGNLVSESVVFVYDPEKGRTNLYKTTEPDVELQDKSTGMDTNFYILIAIICVLVVVVLIVSTLFYRTVRSLKRGTKRIEGTPNLGYQETNRNSETSETSDYQSMH